MTGRAAAPRGGEAEATTVAVRRAAPADAAALAPLLGELGYPVGPAAVAARLGALLVRKAAELARAEGCAALELTTGRQRHAAHAFYAAQGFAWTALRFARALVGDGAAEARR